MAMRRIGLLAAIAIGLLAPAASAQDDPKAGITMGYPASVGIIWQVNDRVASSTPGPTIACVGHASMQSVQAPH